MHSDTSRLLASLENIGSVRVAVIGDFCLDIYWHADMRRSELSRETPHFPLPVIKETMNPGGAGNVAANLLALAPQHVSCLGIFGADWRGEALKKLLTSRNADVSGIITDPARQTNTYIKPLRYGISDVIYEDPRLDFTNFDSPAPETEEKLLAALDEIALKSDVLCVSDQMPFGCITPAVRNKITMLGEQGMTVIVDSRDRIGLYQNVILKPNDIEAARALGIDKLDDIEQVKLGAEKLAEQTKRPVIITLGERGCVAYENGKAVHVPAFSVTGEIDFCGAGDTFLSALACTYASGHVLTDACTLACAASAVTIKKLKTTGTATRQEITRRLRQ